MRAQPGQQQFRGHLEDRVFGVGYRVQLILKCCLVVLAAAEALLARSHEIEVVAALRGQCIRQGRIVGVDIHEHRNASELVSHLPVLFR